MSSPNPSKDDYRCPWELIRVICETILSVCGERFCIPLVRLIQGRRIQDYIFYVALIINKDIGEQCSEITPVDKKRTNEIE